MILFNKVDILIYSIKILRKAEFSRDSFGMVHDAGVTSEGCGSREGATLHVMTASFEADTEEVAWSPCSRRAITRFLE